MTDMEATPHACGANDRTRRIAELNDQLRRRGLGGKVVVTRGVLAIEGIRLSELMATVAQFNSFSRDNDPYNERDFGAFEFGGAKLFWKIDYYDKEIRFGSPDPANPDVTTRVLTIFLREEY